MAGLLTTEQVAEALDESLTRWHRQGNEIVRAVEAPTFADGIRLVDRVAEAAEAANHHPDIDIRWTTVTFRLSTHSAGGITDGDLAMARQIDALVQ
ncbi:MAG TPA: 4a-hydroxytetrahydrobiopterin dehydratase [Nocardioidaceae bacterium]|nr:4a-hydroxytetrahydrobiopterin dehydratase [Nocardioidaceae bacterium]